MFSGKSKLEKGIRMTWAGRSGGIRVAAVVYTMILGAWPLAAWPPDPGELAWIAAGRFTMGSPVTEAGRSTDEVMTEVTLTQGFYLGRYEVRQREYLAVMGENPSQFTGDLERPVSYTHLTLPTSDLV